MDVKKFIPKPESGPEQKNTLSERFDLLNDKGEKFAESYIQINELPAEKKEETRQRLDSWKIVSNEGEEIDMLAYLKPVNPIYLSTDGKYYHSTPKMLSKNTDSYAKVPKPDSVEHIFILLHELGHMDQKGDIGNISLEEESAIHDRRIVIEYPRFEIASWHTAGSQVVDTITSFRERMRKKGMIYHVKEEEETIAGIQELTQLSKEYFDAMERLEESGQITKDEDIDNNPELNALVEKWKRKKEELGENRLINFFGSPKMFLEKDATRRALSWVVDLKKNHGVSLYSVKENNIAGPIVLREALRSYRDKLEI